MIDWKLSAELNITTEGELRVRFVRYPQSNKKVVAVCDGCGKVRTVNYSRYFKLCHKCSSMTPESRKANSLRCIARFSDPVERELARLRAIARFSDPAARKQMSDSKKQYFIDNPDAGKEQSAKLVMYYEDNPEAREAARLRGVEQFCTQESRDNLSETLKKSEARKAQAEKQVGGNDIVGHHMIYDHSDLTKNVIPMTRSMHTRLHKLFQKHGIKIPRVNIGEPYQSNSGGIHDII